MSQFIQTLFDWLSSQGYFGIALGLMVEVIPSEIVLSYGGYLVSIGKISFIGALPQEWLEELLPSGSYIG